MDFRLLSPREPRIYNVLVPACLRLIVFCIGEDLSQFGAQS